MSWELLHYWIESISVLSYSTRQMCYPAGGSRYVWEHINQIKLTLSYKLLGCHSWYYRELQSNVTYMTSMHLCYRHELNWILFMWRLWQMEDLWVWGIGQWQTHTSLECQWHILGHHHFMLPLLLHQLWLHHRGPLFSDHSVGLITRKPLTLSSLETLALNFSETEKKTSSVYLF